MTTVPAIIYVLRVHMKKHFSYGSAITAEKEKEKERDNYAGAITAYSVSLWRCEE